ncbi:hypothetical protein K502DRAFT_361165 [Neoconidiobolus thromboides FSU 785]|nr:hypothetical protein K502DRAFT_361165 [Neoconidiobolus thromboides FSU 785]
MKLTNSLICLALISNNSLLALPAYPGEGNAFNFLGGTLGSTISSLGTSFGSTVTKKEEKGIYNPLNNVAGGLGVGIGAIGKGVTDATRNKDADDINKGEIAGGVAGLAVGKALGKTVKTITNGEVPKPKEPQTGSVPVDMSKPVDYEDDKL